MRYLSFVVRLWVRDEDPEDTVLVRGRIDHIQSTGSARISQLDHITAFIQVYLHPSLQEPTQPPGDPG